MKNKTLPLKFKTIKQKQEYQKLILEIKGNLPDKKSNHEIVIMALRAYKREE